MRLRDKIAVITGAAQGIGFACARRFIAEGARVVLVDVSADKGRDAAKVLGDQASFVAADVGSAADVERLFAEVEREHGRVDVLIANAGIVTTAEFLDITEAD